MELFIMKLKFAVSIFLPLAVVFFAIDCRSFQGSGYTYNANSAVYSKPDTKSKIAFELKGNLKFDILEQVPNQDSSGVSNWYKIKKEGQVGYLEEARYKKDSKSKLLFLKLKKPKFGMTIATSLFLRSEPSLSGAILEKLQTKDIVEILEEGTSAVPVNGKSGHWAKVKSKNDKVGFVFTPYLMMGDSSNSFSSVEDSESNETGWAFLKNEPKFIFKKQNGKLQRFSNDQLSANQFYLIQSRYLSKDGKIFFHIVKQSASLADWYADLEVTLSADCYVPAESVQVSTHYASLYARVNEPDRKKIKIFEFLSQEISDDVDPEFTSFDSFTFKKVKYYVMITSNKSDYDECKGCFGAERYNRVFVFEERRGGFKLIFSEAGSRRASFDQYSGRPVITISDSPPVEGDQDPSKITNYSYGFNGSEFILNSTDVVR
ncbi:SH3 domain-containing protein [Leptospira yasudae]|uniref:SH3 domain-containing protein n=1 Tax=Leptospira yasudae TaxID=2202201 RepID=A0A6N4R1P9_9LEPT|nr:SH3 domain-containing protein [Leptospira yasudae]TGL80273.1 SH3 domain-containing protein [Leptospira yasudae]TGL82150.1 SH3 domain-containing protein [Leptospira yasudae]TGL86972.1 SH3 domain-containing protein [Leptospira yasudae]